MIDRAKVLARVEALCAEREVYEVPKSTSVLAHALVTALTEAVNAELGDEALDCLTNRLDAALSETLVPAGTWCSVCGGMQFECPSGLVCSNGHGGAPSLDAPPKGRYEGEF